MDSHINDLKESLHYFQYRMHNLISSLSRTRNHHSSVPLTKLPNEIVIEVFKLVVEPNDWPGQLARLRTLQLVGSHWHEIIDKTPEFWRHISNEYPSDFIKKALNKARAAGLNINAYVSGCPYPMDMYGDKFNALLRPASRLWTKAKIHLDNLSEETARNILDIPVPILTELTLDCSYVSHKGPWAEPPPSMTIFPGPVPCLRHLNLKYVPIRWSSDLLKGLRTLTLVVSIAAPSLLEFIGVLEACPELESLDFQGCIGLSENKPATPVKLCKLAKLYIWLFAESPCLVADVLHHIRAPECLTAWLSLDLRSNLGLIDADGLMSALPKIFQRIPLVECVEYTPHGTQLHGPDTEFILGVRMNVNIPMPGENLAWFGNMTREFGQAALRMDISGGSWLASPEAQDVLLSFRELTSLTFRWGTEVGEFWQLLERRSVNGSPLFLLPKLGRITFDECAVYLEHVLSMVRDRYADTHEPGLPVRLEVLDVGDINPHDEGIANNIQALLGPNVFRYEIPQSGFPRWSGYVGSPAPAVAASPIEQVVDDFDGIHLLN